MSAPAFPGILTATIALLSAAALALINSAITARVGIDEDLRAQRLKAYPVLWEASGSVSRWPRQDVTRASLEALHQDLRGWYYSTGGLFLSAQARARYGDVQEHIDVLLRSPAHADHSLAEDRYSDLMQTASALRTALTEDLDTRRRKSLWEKGRRRGRHVRARRRARTRIQAAGRDPAPFVAAGP